MRGRVSFAPLGLVLAAALVGSAASAAPFTGTLTVYVFDTQQEMPAVVFGGGDGGSSAALVTIPGDAFVGTATATTPTSIAAPITENRVIVTGHDPGSFSGATLAGAMALRGALRFWGLGGGTAGPPLLEVPLSVVGSPGAKGTWASGPIALTAHGAAWSAGNVAVTLPTSLGGTVMTSFAGYDHRVNGLGTLQLVTPVRVETNLAGTLVIWSALTLTFVPEPSTALLFGGGTLALAALGRRRAAARAREGVQS